MQIGVPRVSPSKTPLRIFPWSASSRGVTISLCPGRRRSRSRWTSASVSGMRGGQPSMTTPTPPPWDSPQVEMRKAWPNWLDIKGCRSKSPPPPAPRGKCGEIRGKVAPFRQDSTLRCRRKSAPTQISIRACSHFSGSARGRLGPSRFRGSSGSSEFHRSNFSTSTALCSSINASASNLVYSNSSRGSSFSAIRSMPSKFHCGLSKPRWRKNLKPRSQRSGSRPCIRMMSARQKQISAASATSLRSRCSNAEESARSPSATRPKPHEKTGHSC